MRACGHHAFLEEEIKTSKKHLEISKEHYDKLEKENQYLLNKNEFLLSVIKDKDAEIAILRKAQEK